MLRYCNGVVALDLIVAGWTVANDQTILGDGFSSEY